MTPEILFLFNGFYLYSERNFTTHSAIQESPERSKARVLKKRKMSQPGTSKNYSYPLDTINVGDSGSEALRIEEPEDVGTDPNAEGIESDPVDHNSDGSNGRRQKKKGNRYTEYQLQVLQAFCEEHPNPNRRQREELSQALGLTPLQIKFWYQNRRNRLRGRHRAQEMARLESKIEELQEENAKCKEAFRATCLKCGGQMTSTERQLILENAHLKNEIGKIFGIASRSIGRPLIPDHPHLPSPPHAPWQFQLQSSPMRPTLMLFEAGSLRHPERNDHAGEPTVMADRSNLGAPSYGPCDVCDLTLRIADPQNRTS